MIFERMYVIFEMHSNEKICYFQNAILEKDPLQKYGKHF